MKVLVTGGAGFIGSHLCEKLREKGYEVIAFDNLSVGSQALPFLERAGVEFIKGDVGNYGEVERVVKQVDGVFHLAAMNRAGRSIENPLEAHHSNITGTLNVFEACRQNNVERIVFVSSSSVLGGSEGDLHPHAPFNPLHPYAVGKASGEMYAKVYNSIFGLKITTLRYFSIYGPRQRGDIGYAAVIPKLVQQAFEGQPLTVYGDGTQKRNFTFIDDAVNATIKAFESSKGIGKTLHVANNEENSILDIVKTIKEKTKLKAGIEFKPLPPGDPARNYPSIDLTVKELNWTPETKLDKGIEEFVEWFNGVKK